MTPRRQISAVLLFFLASTNSLDMNTAHIIKESVWRDAAHQHKTSICRLLAPGLLPAPVLTARQQLGRNKTPWKPLDAKHPVYNFLIEYYGLKGTKGPKRLARWSPSFVDIPRGCTSILLENAHENDIGETLHMRGATLVSQGIAYSPEEFFGRGDSSRLQESTKSATAYLWYRTILKQTLQSEPVLHCHGLHEWAMQYQPEGAPLPPSAKYQAHLPLRVSRKVICEAVERKGVHCTHVDALRFFAPAAGPLNHHGSRLERIDQLRLEQRACIHAHMDLLKICLRLAPFVDASLVQSVLELALDARRLDVAASPYDASAYGVDIVPIEKPEGRAEYRLRQRVLMFRADPIRRELLKSYEALLSFGFDGSVLDEAERRPAADRFAQASPGGKPWRKSLLHNSGSISRD